MAWLGAIAGWLYFALVVVAVALISDQALGATGLLGDNTLVAQAGRSFGARFLNTVVDGLVVGLIIALTSVGLSLIFGVTGLVNFAQAELVTWGLLDITWGVMNIATAMYFMLIINWKLALIVFALIPVLVVVAALLAAASSTSSAPGCVG